MDSKFFTSSENSLLFDKFLYFFMGLRKGDVRRRVALLKARYPEESPDELARRLIDMQSGLSLVGGALLHVPLFMPQAQPVIRVLGMAGGAGLLLQMHMALILEIALVYGHDIDDRARMKELAAILAASAAVSCTPFLTRALDLKSYWALITGAMTVSSGSQLIGEAALIYYRNKAMNKAKLASPPGAEVAAAG